MGDGGAEDHPPQERRGVPQFLPDVAGMHGHIFESSQPDGV